MTVRWQRIQKKQVFYSVETTISGKIVQVSIIQNMTSRAIYQNISPEVAGKPWRVISPDAEGRG
jgi:hypothetical protein